MGRIRWVVALVVLATALPAAGGARRPGDAAAETREALRAAALLQGLPAEVVDAPPVDRTHDLRAALTALYDTLGIDADLRPVVDALARMDQSARAALARLVDAVAAATRARAAAYATLHPRDIASLAVAAGSGTMDAEASALLARIDRAAMLHAASTLHATAAAVLPDLRGVALAQVTCTPAFVLCVGTEGDDLYAGDVQILIEPAGDDLYLNNAGGAASSQASAATGGCVLGGGLTGKARPNLDCSPAPSGVCTYDTANRAAGRDDLPAAGLPGHANPEGPDAGRGSDGSCGSDARRDRLLDSTQRLDRDADSRGVAILLDLDGSDTYTVPWSHEDPLFGLIEDCFPGESDKVNTNRDLFQGSGLAGIGLLWDDGEGDDIWRGRLNAQGSGHVGGVGLHIVSGRGDAVFWADRLSQGSGIAAGVGALINTRAGRHTYLLDAPVVYRNEFSPGGRGCAQEGRAGQGQGGFGGVGILWNAGEGDAVYRAVTHLTADIHPYAAVLDDQGAPLLVGGSDAQGSGESFPLSDTPGGLVAGVGLLLDRTDGDASICPPAPDGTPAAGMVAGSSTSAGIDLSTIGVVAPCGTFNLPAELDPAGDLGTALQRLLAGAVGIRVVA